MDAKRTGALIAELRREKDLNQSELAELIGVTNKAVSRWETGRGYPDIETLPRISDVLNISIPELLRGERIQQPSSSVPDRADDLSLQQSTVEQDTSILTVCHYAGQQTRKQKRKIIALSILLAIVVFLFSIVSLAFQFLPMILDLYVSMNDAYYSYSDFYSSIVGSPDCIVAYDHNSLTYLGNKYIPIILKDCDAVDGEKMVDECQVENMDFWDKLPFGESLYEVKNVPNHEMVYLQTDYDYCRSNYFVLETEYDRYRKLLEEVEFGTYYSEYCNESFYRWERQLTPDLCAWLQTPDTAAVSEEPESLAVLNIRMYDTDHIFYRDAGRIYQTGDGYYWFPEAFASYTYEPDSAGLGQYFPVQSGKYFPISGFDNELNELFSN